MESLEGKTAVISGGTRGIGLAIALRFAKAKSNVVVLAKETAVNIKEASDQILKAGGKALVLNVDISDEKAIKMAITHAVNEFGCIDFVVNNTSTICFTKTHNTTPEQFDLIVATSTRAAFFLSQACLPYLKKSTNPHIINISPPIQLDSKWFKDHLPFTIGKYGMSMCTIGMSAELKKEGIAVNSLWPETTIATQTIKNHFSEEVYKGSRWPSIMGDAAYTLALKPSQENTGLFFTDEALLRESGVDDFSQYAVDSSAQLMQDFFVPIDTQKATVSKELFLINQNLP